MLNTTRRRCTISVAHLYVFLSYLLGNLNSLMTTSVPCERSSAKDTIFILKTDQLKLRDFFKTCPRALELITGTRAGTRTLTSDFILVCPFQNSSCFLSYVQVTPSVLRKAYPFHSYLKCIIYKDIFCCPWHFLQTSAQSS